MVPRIHLPRLEPPARSAVAVLARVLGLALLAAQVIATPLAAANPPAPVDEYQLKAAFLERFLAFVHWPAATPTASPGPRTLGIVGRNPFTASSVPGGKPPAEALKSLRIVPCLSPEEAARCHMVFFCDADDALVRATLETLQRLPILTVGEGPQFARRGGMISMVPADRRIRLEINAEKVRLGGLRLDPQLLNLATLVPSSSP